MATEAVIEEVAQNLEEAAEVTRRLDSKFVGGFVGGLVVGVAVGFYFGHRWNKEKIRAEAFKKSDEEVKAIREFYQDTAKIVTEKPSLDDVVEQKGYSTPVEVPERPTRPPVPVQEAPPILPKRDYVQPGIAKRHVDREKDKNEGWDYAVEVAKRSPSDPYIIHQDEYTQNEPEYIQVTYTYYAVDGVLTDEDEDRIDDPEPIVGLTNLGYFGHGADDYHVLYIRNEQLNLDFEVCLVPQSYEETVEGLSSDGEN